MENANFRNYGHYKRDNYGAHTLCFTDSNGNQFYYSYKTLVAFRAGSGSLVIRENVWGPTTGKHLNWIHPDKNLRVNSEVFQQKYAEAFGV